ncbi:MAG: methyltransferase domain-containing protein [Dehalococcoidia bacterium]|nr:methyltransferase domain-containing protein [Dehalococcoidia bacterium]
MGNADAYTHGHHASVVGHHATRTAEEAAAFLLPRLEPGMRLLDFGCGPGTITAGLARAVAPGETIGINAAAEVVADARSRAAGLGLANLRFEVGSIYERGFEEASFDVVYAHQVLQHLARPVGALRSAMSLLKQGGIVAVRDVDWATVAIAPETPELSAFLRLYSEVARSNGGEPNAGRYLPRWLADAGFKAFEVSAATWTFADEAARVQWGDAYAQRAVESGVARRALELGLATPADLRGMAKAWKDWARTPYAFMVMTHVAALGPRP